MATLTTENLDVNVPVVESLADVEMAALTATAYFEDYLFKIIADISAINDEIVSGAVTDGANVGGFTEVFQEKNGSILEFRTLQSSDGSVTITQNADDIDLQAASLAGTVANSILTYDLGGSAYTELPQFRVSFSGGVITIEQDDGGGGAVTLLTSDGDGQTGLFFDGAEVANTRVAADGALFINNLSTGAGFERVLTTADLGGGLPTPTVNNSILTGDLGGGDFDELTEVTIAWAAGVMTIEAENDAAALIDVIVADADAGTQFFFDANLALDTRAAGIGVFDDVGDNPRIEFLQDDGATINGNIIFNGASDIAAMISQRNGGTVELRGDDTGGTEQTMVFADPDADVQLEFDGTVVFATTVNGVAVYDSAGGNDPLIELIDNFAGGSRNAFINGNSIGLFLENEVHGMPVTLRSEDSGGTVRDLVSGDPDDAVELYFDGGTVPAMRTMNSGIDVIDNTGDNPFVAWYASDGTTRHGFIQFQTAGVMQIQNEVHGGLIRLLNEDAGGTDQTVLEGDPDDALDLYFDGALVVETADDGLRVIPSTGTPTISGDGQIWYDDTGLDTFRARVAGVNADLPQLTQGSFTPTFDFATTGDLSVAYNGTRIGYYWRIGNQVFFRIEVSSMVPTHTTAAGNAQITGLPFAVDTTNGSAPIWEVQVSKTNDGWGNAAAAMVKGFGTNNLTQVEFFADGINIASQVWDVNEFGTGNNVGVLRIYGFYETDAAIT